MLCLTIAHRSTTATTTFFNGCLVSDFPKEAVLSGQNMTSNRVDIFTAAVPAVLDCYITLSSAVPLDIPGMSLTKAV